MENTSFVAISISHLSPACICPSRRGSPALSATVVRLLELSFTDSSQNPDTRQPVKFVDELVDLAVGGFDLALKRGLAQVKD